MYWHCTEFIILPLFIIALPSSPLSVYHRWKAHSAKSYGKPLCVCVPTLPKWERRGGTWVKSKQGGRRNKIVRTTVLHCSNGSKATSEMQFNSEKISPASLSVLREKDGIFSGGKKTQQVCRIRVYLLVLLRTTAEGKVFFLLPKGKSPTIVDERGN